MRTLLADNVRRAAHGLHVCGFCGSKIAARSRYRDQRIAEGGTAWTWRAHLDCTDRYWRAHHALFLDDEDHLPWSDVLEWEAEQGDLPHMTTNNPKDSEC